LTLKINHFRLFGPELNLGIGLFDLALLLLIS